MNKTNNLYCLILAGGKGRRLWPESCEDMPKQFIDFFGTGRTQLQQTFDRFNKFIPTDHILISTNIRYRELVKEQLPQISDSNILAEPIYRNTAPSIAWGTHRIYHFNNDSVVIVAPSDQQVLNEDVFKEDVIRGYEFAYNNNTVLTMGVKPTRPEPGYGYIQFQGQVADGVYSVRSFTEKPDREFAKVFLQSGEFYWNTGMLMARSSYLLDNFKDLLPVVLRNIDTGASDYTIDDENRYVSENFTTYPNVSMEQGVLEKINNVTVMKCDFGWADLGTWHGIYEAKHNNEGDNVVLDSDVILDNSHGNIIKIPKGHLAVISGMSGYIVIEKGDTLLICPREDSSALIRKYSAEVKIR